MSDDTKKPENPHRRRFLRDAGLVPAALYLEARAPVAARQSSMMGHVVPNMARVRVGVIGAGRRGTTILRLLAGIDGVDIKAVCDPYPPAIESARALLAESKVAAPRFHWSEGLACFVGRIA